MLFSTFYTKSFLLLGALSVVTANPIPADDDVFTDIQFTTGEPELLELEEKRSLDSEFALDQGVSLALLPRANADQKEALRLHNAARAKKSLKALVWDTTLEANALAYAKELAKIRKLVHSSGDSRKGQGENLAMASSSGTISNPITLATKGWLNEESKYHGEVIPQGDFASYGHYTQCMWKSTTKVGIATASDGKGGWWTVARYSPPGNYVGQKPY